MGSPRVMKPDLGRLNLAAQEAMAGTGWFCIATFSPFSISDFGFSIGELLLRSANREQKG
jgi:hypothetical protein